MIASDTEDIFPYKIILGEKSGVRGKLRNRIYKQAAILQ